MSKAALYIRVSTHWQADKDSLSVQERELKAYCDMILGISDTVVFKDVGYSAKNTDRPAYQEMISRIKRKEFTHLLVWKIDRISRNLLDFTGMYAELRDLGVTFVSKNEQFDTSSAIGEAMLKIILVFAELERKMTAERVSAVMLSRASQGQWNGGHVPIGYEYIKDTDSFRVVEREKNIVQSIYNLYEQNQSLLKVAETLNNQGILSKKNNIWNPVSIHHILTNPFYIGSYTYGSRSDSSEKIYLTNHHPAIISEHQFCEIREMLQRNKRRSNFYTYRRKNVNVFSGLVVCGSCGAHMNATSARLLADGWRPTRYGCPTRRKSKEKCRNLFIQENYLGPFFLTYISNLIKAKKHFKNCTSKEQLESWLLLGKPLLSVKCIEENSLNDIYNNFLKNNTGMEYQRPKTSTIVNPDLLSSLKEQKSMYETALVRLKKAYLYSKQETPENDFVLEREKILRNLQEIDSKIARNTPKDKDIYGNADEFETKGSYFLMLKTITNNDVDYETLARTTDKNELKRFVNTIVTEIVSLNAKVVSITFKNGVCHKFIYKE